MATNVLVIPEDFRNDQYVLKPIIEKMFAALGVRARVQVCCDPLLGGVGEALKKDRIDEVIERYKGMTRVFLLIVDRDCDKNRRTKLDALEAHASQRLATDRAVFLAQEAHQECEVWVLAGLQNRPADWKWKDVRSECHPKEKYFDAIASARGVASGPGEGRIALTSEAAANYPRIRKLCPDDVGALETRIRNALAP
jgi:hypothetical protein